MVKELVDDHMEAKVRIKRRAKDPIPFNTKKEITHITLVIKIMEIKEVKEDLNEDREEEASVELVFNA